MSALCNSILPLVRSYEEMWNVGILSPPSSLSQILNFVILMHFCASWIFAMLVAIVVGQRYSTWIWQDLSNMDTTSAFFDLFLHTGARVVKCVNIYYSRTNAFTTYCNSGAFLWFLLLQIFNIWATFIYCWRWIICIEYDKCILYQNIYLIPSFNRGASCENSKHNQNYE